VNDATQRALTGGALRLLGETLGTCTSVTWPLQNETVLCQKPANHMGRHSAQTVFGIFDWGEPTGYQHHPEVVSGVCDPDDEHDRAKESREDPL
jgi:hypothetical protein